MKISENPTNYILVKAYTSSEWDCCDFAIITCDDKWLSCMQERLEAVRKVQEVTDFWALKFFDYSVDFFQSSEDNASELLSEMDDNKMWAFVEFEDGEEDNLSRPENALDGYIMNLFNDFTCRYTALGKHTGEEFFTERIPTEEIAAFIQNHENNFLMNGRMKN